MAGRGGVGVQDMLHQPCLSYGMGMCVYDLKYFPAGIQETVVGKIQRAGP